MISLKADNRILTQNAKYSYLVANYVSNATNLSVLNATDSVFATDAYLLLGNFGSETAEIVQISTVNNTTGAIVLVSATKFAHPESTRVTVLPYNQIRFFWTPIEVFNTATPLTVYLDLQPSDWFTTYDDGSHPTGYGWFIFYNSTTLLASQQSNSLPYEGFKNNSIEDLLNDFFSLLNNKELKLVTRADALSWLNEGYSKIRNKLNLCNREYSASVLKSITTQAGIYEYDLPLDFSDLISITGGLNQSSPMATGMYNKYPINYIPLTAAAAYVGSETMYYIRGKKIGFVPVPNGNSVINYIYLAKTMRIGTNSELVDLPDNGFFAIKDWMCFRAFSKFGNTTQAASYYKIFSDQVDEMLISAIDRDANLDSWGFTPESMS
jgi:hypothetical protein